MQIGFVEENDLLRGTLSFYLQSNLMKISITCFKQLREIKNHDSFYQLDILIIDIQDDHDFTLINDIKRYKSDLKIILLSPAERLIENYLYAQKKSLSAFVSKESHPEALIQTILSIRNGDHNKFIISKKLQEQIEQKMKKNDRLLSRKECAILDLIGEGKTTKEISAILNLSARTIETHRHRMIERFGTNNIIPVILYAIKKKLLNIHLKKEQLVLYPN